MTCYDKPKECMVVDKYGYRYKPVDSRAGLERCELHEYFVFGSKAYAEKCIKRAIMWMAARGKRHRDWDYAVFDIDSKHLRKM